MAVQFDVLPGFLKREILAHVPPSDLPHCRLVSSSISEFATERVFRSVILKVDALSARAFEQIGRSDRLRKHVREVTVETNCENYEYVRLG